MYRLHKHELEFAWDPAKDEENQRKHGVSFKEAAMAFFDDHAGLFHDPDESEDEDRYILIGLSDKPRLIIVCHCYRGNGPVIRIISARKPDSRETAAYAED